MTTDEKMLPDDGDDLSPAVIEFAGTLFANPLSTSAESFEVEQLVRCLSGLLPEPQLTSIFKDANRNAVHRHSLIQVRRNLDTLESMTWAEVAAQAQSQDELMASTAHAWLKIMNEQLSAKSTASERWQSGWKAVRDLVKQGVAGAQAAQTDFISFAEQWRRTVLLPSIALQRGDDDTLLRVRADQDDLEIVMDEVAIDSTGTLRAKARVLDSSESVSNELDGRPIYFGLTTGNEIWPISSAIPVHGAIEWVEEEIGRIANLPSIHIPRSYLWLGLERPSSIQSEYTILLAEVVDHERLPAAAVTVNGEPVWEGGELHLAIGLPLTTRELHLNAHLEISLTISQDDHQLLGKWPISEWPDTDAQLQVRRLIVPCPGSPNVDRISPFSLHMRILVD